MVATIKKTSFEECVFWAGEAYYSGFGSQLLEFIWTMYYDFYATTYPKYESKFSKLSHEWKTNNALSCLLYMANTLYHSRPNSTVFYLRLLNPATPSSVYVGRTPTWLKKLALDKQGRKLTRSIHSMNMVNVAFHLKCYANRPSAAYAVVKKYFREVKGLSLGEAALDNIPYSKQDHIVLALICHLLKDEDEIKKRAIFRKLSPSILTKCAEFDRAAVEPARLTLPRKRLFPVSSLVGYLPLSRNQARYPDGQPLRHDHLVWYHWEYFAYNSPLWRKRFESYDATRDESAMKVVFADDDELDDFSLKYGYEPDEQSSEVQDRSTREIPMVSLPEFLSQVFDGDKIEDIPLE